MIDMEKLRDEITFDEGCKLDVYLCSEGHPTVGIGHKIRKNDEENELQIGDAINSARCEALFTQDVAIACRDCAELFSGFGALPGDVKRVIINMAFQLGRPRLALFEKFRAAIQRQDFLAAAAEMLDSRWARQTPERVARLHQRMMNAVQTNLTESQQRVYDEICQFWEEHSYAPSYADLADRLSLSINAAVESVRRLQKKGYVFQNEGLARSLIPTDLRDHVRKFYAKS